MSQESIAPPGWYGDPSDPTLFRWWNGTTWTSHSSPKSAPPVLYAANARKDTGIAYLFYFLLGGLGAHHFYLGNKGTAIALLCLWLLGWSLTPIGVGFILLAVAGIWLLVDLFSIPQYARDANEDLIPR